ncbi:MAG: hypothetical protein ACD_75C01444G0002 [uncultured bacterium]|nr:MAG: hypothetical protein ACD_75C01444G0002 [uncultured bacterium]
MEKRQLLVPGLPIIGKNCHHLFEFFRFLGEAQDRLLDDLQADVDFPGAVEDVLLDLFVLGAVPMDHQFQQLGTVAILVGPQLHKFDG